MGGNNRKKPNRSRGFSSANRGLFVEGGLLSDWSPINTPPSRGSKGNKSGNKKGSGNKGNGKGSFSDSKTGSGSGSGMRSQSTSIKSRGNAIGFVYPQGSAFVDGSENQERDLGGSTPMVLIDSEKTPIVAYLDEGPVKESETVDYIYDYTSGFTLGESSSHRGLGFRYEVEETTDGIGSSSKFEEKESGATELSSSEAGEMDADVQFMGDEDDDDNVGEDLPAEAGEMDADVQFMGDEDEDVEEEHPAVEKNRGYVVIGGTKIYTEDTSDEEEEEISDGVSSDSDDESETSESDGSSSSGSDIDDDMAADYFEGIGGAEDIVNVNQLVGHNSDSSDDSDSEDGFQGTLQKLGGIALQDASREYGLMNPGSGKKYRTKNKKSGNSYHTLSSFIDDDLTFLKDPRTLSGRKKHVSRLPSSWPSESRKSKGKKSRRIPGEKKKHRKETIAVKRRDRMVRRGVDPQKINLKLQQIVLDGLEMFSFQPMHTRDCSQVRRLAAIYRLKSGCQGSGKKRFVTVIRTPHTCMPSASDTIRLEKLMGPDENADFSVIDGKPIKADTSAGKKTPKTRASREAKKNKGASKVGSYAAQPLSFVPSGILNAEVVEVSTIVPTESKDTCNETKTTSNSVEYGAFEMHTTGFGSKMLAKMGYIEGSGLGKEGQGMTLPIEALQRPRSLGLGADAPETSGKSPNVQPQMKSPIVQPQSKSTKRDIKSSGSKSKSATKEVPKLGSFERHTKGFGSKMMARMGFKEGTGLGRDSQGIVDPLVAVRRPKARGLGAER